MKGLIDLIAEIGFKGDRSKARDTLGRVYEYFLSKFAAAERKLGGEFFTPRSIVRLLVEMLEPYEGRVYDPCCGSAGMFVQSERFVEAHGGRKTDISIFGQESNPTTWRLAHMRGGSARLNTLEPEISGSAAGLNLGDVVGRGGSGEGAPPIVNAGPKAPDRSGPGRAGPLRNA